MHKANRNSLILQAAIAALVILVCVGIAVAFLVCIGVFGGAPNKSDENSVIQVQSEAQLAQEYLEGYNNPYRIVAT